jgi:hypothetical protein
MTGKEFYLIDTPGFVDSSRSDQNILREVASWLTKTYAENVKLSGIIYLHRIADVRLSGSAMNNLRLFKKLCDRENMDVVVLATTVWDMISDTVGQTREIQLQSTPNYWGEMIERGSQVFGHNAKEYSGAAIVQYLLGRREKPVYAIQDEMVNQKKTLEETAASMPVAEQIERIRKEYEQALSELEQIMSKAVKEHDLIAQQEIEQTRKEREERIQKKLQANRRMHADVDALWQQRETEREKGHHDAYNHLMSLQTERQQLVSSAGQSEALRTQTADMEKKLTLALKRSKVRFWHSRKAWKATGFIGRSSLAEIQCKVPVQAPELSWC